MAEIAYGRGSTGRTTSIGLGLRPKRGPLAYRLKDALAANRARRTEKAAFQRARLIISNSKRTTDELVKYFQVDPARVHTVYLGSDPEWGPISPEERAASRKLLESRRVAQFGGFRGSSRIRRS